ncbi:hypothetical protein [Flavobacterium sp. W21_SRS_FM6]|uniref:hypothetical protein n=1 Tax=Flavobacterium sp. W21_SRS_FM6 TaxID=3240268 RepID=UPI003F90178B
MLPTQLTVSNLYEAVWHEPLKSLAERWQLHPHALGQLLDRHSIPRPPNGYWTQKALGKEVAITPLSKDMSPSRLIDLVALQGSKREKSKRQALPLPPPIKTLGRYPLLKAIKSSLTKSRHQYDFILTQAYDDNSVLRLDVSSEQRDRAIAILHSLMSAFDESGWSVKVETRSYEKRLMNIVTVDDVDIQFRLRERLKQQKRELTAKEKMEKARKEWVWKENINVPSGVLQLYIEGPLPQGMKSLFEDRALLSLENQLGTFVEHLKVSAAHSKVLEEERKVREREWEEKLILREKYERAVKVEQQQIQAFLDMFSKWQRANECRAFINEVMASDQAKAFSEEELCKWKVWSERIADTIDPLKTSDLKNQVSHGRVFDAAIFEAALLRQQ